MRRLTAILLGTMLVALGAPSAALAQSAGDEQYEDPLGGAEPEVEPAPPPAAPPAAAQPAPAAATQSSAQPAAPPAAAPNTELPRTGGREALLAALGLACLAAGLSLRRLSTKH